MYSKLDKKNLKNTAGFSLIEVLVAIMVLTVAIVSASNMLGALVRSNRNSLNAMKAYYLAQEGVEAVRNIRDSNWLHNSYWLGEEGGAPWGDKFETGYSYYVELRSSPWEIMADENISADSLAELDFVSPWRVERILGDDSFEDADGFSRKISIKDYDGEDEGCFSEGETVCVLVESTVSWNIGAAERDITVFAVLTDWKSGML